MSKVHLILGAQGAGKSTYAKKLAQEIKGVHMSIDQWMWSMFEDDLPKSMNFKWIMERVTRCENQIWELSKKILDCHCPVILDLGFTKVEKRNKFIALAKEHNTEIQIHYLKAPHTIRRERVLARNVEKGETYSFEVTPGMFDFMEGEYHAPTDSELKHAIILDHDHQS